MRRAFWAAWLLSMAPACARTELVVVVDTNLAVPEGLDGIVVNATGPTMRTYTASGALTGTRRITLPATTWLSLDESETGPVVITATGFLGSTVVLQRTAVTSFSRGETRVVRLPLLAACANLDCPDGQTCDASGACHDDTIDGITLPTWPDGTSGDDVDGNVVTLRPWSDIAATAIYNAGPGSPSPSIHYPLIADGTTFDAGDSYSFLRTAPGAVDAQYTCGFPPPRDGAVPRVAVHFEASSAMGATGSVTATLLDGESELGTGPMHPLSVMPVSNLADVFDGLSLSNGRALRVRLDFHVATGASSGALRVTRLWLEVTVAASR